MVIAVGRLRTDIDEILPGVIADRRHLHQHPELGFQEYETAKFVAERLRSLGVEEIRTGIAETGVTGLIRGARGDGKVVLLRADMDALPIDEENEVDYRSRNPGVMHACGHDAHTAMLLGTTRMLLERRDQFAGAVKVLFQPCEESPPGGAKPMIEAGVMDDPKVDGVFGLHVLQNLPLGRIGVGNGPISANSDRFRIVLQGKGGHGARPELAVDPIVVGAQVVVALQTLVARERDPLAPAVVTVGAFHAGKAPNVIPDSAEMVGTIRTFSADSRQQITSRIKDLVEGIASAMRATATVEVSLGYPSVMNDPGMTDVVRAAAAEVVGQQNIIERTPQPGGEDFSYFSLRAPASFFYVGTKNDEKGLVWGHHHPKFDIDEEGLAIGIETMTRAVLRYLTPDP
ncbi:MAG: M20 metallopeptidase family protein [Thermomicrobiales bacterium]